MNIEEIISLLRKLKANQTSTNLTNTETIDLISKLLFNNIKDISIKEGCCSATFNALTKDYDLEESEEISIEDVENALNEIQTNLNKCSTDLDNSKRTIKALTTMQGELIAREENLQTQITNKDNEIADIKRQLEEAKTVVPIPEDYQSLQLSKSQCDEVIKLLSEGKRLNPDKYPNLTRAQIEEINKKNDWKNNRIKTLTDSLATAQIESNNLRSQLSNNQTQLTDVTNQLNAKNRELTNKDNEINTIKGQLTDIQNQLETTSNLLKTRETQLTDKDKEIANKDTELTATKDELEQKKTEIETLKRTQEAEKTGLQSQIDNLQKDLSACQGKNPDQMAARINQLTTQLNQCNNKIPKLQAQIEKQKGTIETQKTKIQTITSQLQEEKAKPRKPDDYEDIKSQLRDTKKDKTDCESVKRQLEGEKLAIQRDMNKILSDLALGKKVVITNVSREVQTIINSDTVRELNSKIDEQNRKLLEAQDEKKALTTTTANLDRERQARQELEAENTQNKNLSNLYKAEADKFKQERDTANSQITNLQNQIRELTAENTRLKAKPTEDAEKINEGETQEVAALQNCLAFTSQKYAELYTASFSIALHMKGVMDDFYKLFNVLCKTINPGVYSNAWYAIDYRKTIIEKDGMITQALSIHKNLIRAYGNLMKFVAADSKQSQSSEFKDEYKTFETFLNTIDPDNKGVKAFLTTDEGKGWIRRLMTLTYTRIGNASDESEWLHKSVEHYKYLYEKDYSQEPDWSIPDREEIFMCNNVPNLYKKYHECLQFWVDGARSSTGVSALSVSQRGVGKNWLAVVKYIHQLAYLENQLISDKLARRQPHGRTVRWIGDNINYLIDSLVTVTSDYLSSREKNFANSAKLPQSLLSRIPDNK